MGSSDSGSGSDEKYHRKKLKKKSKKHKKDKKHKKSKSRKKRERHSTSSSINSDAEQDQWVEKVLPKQSAEQTLKRDDWMNSMLIPTYSKEVKGEEKKTTAVQYDPKTSVRELNPHWQNGGSGLPSFRKPMEDDDSCRVLNTVKYTDVGKNTKSEGWRKSKDEWALGDRKETSKVQGEQATTSTQEDGMFLSDQQLNDLGAKIVKAEIMSNTQLANVLRVKLDAAKLHRNQLKDSSRLAKESDKRREAPADEELCFTVTSSHDIPSKHSKKRRTNPHNFPPDNLTDKFCSERQENTAMDAQFFKVSAKLDREGSNLENIFDHSRASTSSSGRLNEEQIVRDMNKLSKAQADCERCINSSQFLHDNVISMGKNIYLAVPNWKGLQPKHCLIVPVSHYPALTHMDEDVYQELVDTCKTLKRMFTAHEQEVIFFESVRYINRNPHAYVQCVPANNYEMAPFYFKKAILESETEWAMNKKLHNIQGLEIRRTIPKGLPYFWVNFNLDKGFAHVIEDQESFPVTFASETIAGILGLDTRIWRKPGREYHPKQRVEEFQRWWKEFDNLTKEKHCK
ncbi:CWF19-like protein 2 homolog [Topomyia yanbarensis]|uniref:CWF19-like protein 2 homolog n=1 Tax=Topomyia yanbarensis TaxID=2498891 RepID=UPI00273CE406|nr:CWF19-like protein 2 homolog [Topomyia yanbarensis]